MYFSTQLIVVALTIAPGLGIHPHEPRGWPHPSPIYARSYGHGNAVGSLADLPKPTEAPNLDNRAAALDAPFLTLKISNAFGYDLQISYNSNIGSPTIVGNPGPGVFPNAQNTALALPRDFAGAFWIGKTQDNRNSKIEASFYPPQGYRPGVDVSYVDGYGVPITCSCGGVAVTGCNIPLFGTGRTCPQKGAGDRVVCYNPVTNPDGPADQFFQPCQGAAYTYPNDHQANGFGHCDNGDIQCCVGVGCPALSFQHAKRDLFLQFLGYANETEIPAGLC